MRLRARARGNGGLLHRILHRFGMVSVGGPLEVCRGDLQVVLASDLFGVAEPRGDDV